MLTFIIPQGKHSALFNLKSLFEGIIYWKPTRMTLTFKFDESAKYSTTGEDGDDWNKLGGFSRGWHHQNSVRIGWRWNDAMGKVELCTYRYINGTRKFEKLGYASIGETEFFTVQIHDGKLPSWGYKLHPYFGGNEKAPHEIKIRLRYS